MWANSIVSVRFKVPDEKEIAKEEEEEIYKIKYGEVAKRILGISKPEWFSLFLATISAILIGASFPIFAILFAEFYGVKSQVNFANEIFDQNILSSFIRRFP